MKYFILLQLVLLFSSCGKGQGNPDYTFEKATPTEVRMNPVHLDRLITDIETGKIPNIHGIYLIRNDTLVTENYFNDFKSHELHYVASVTKSVASALLGIAIDKGYFGGDIHTVLDRKASDLFPEYAALILEDSLKAELNLRHMLTMTAGLDWDEHTHPYTSSWNDCNRINNSQEPMKFLFERSMIHKPGSVYYYNGGLSLSISWLIEKYTGMRVDQFAEKYLFSALGIKNYRWERVVGGLSDTDGGLHLGLADQAKLGSLFLNGGRWQGKQIISEDWVKESTRAQQINDSMPDYGFQWWCGDFHARGEKYHSYMASGHGGQKILVLPDYNTVLVIAQQVFHNDYGSLNFLAIVSDYIIPALSGPKSANDRIALSRNELSKYAGHYQPENGEEYMDVIAGDGHLVVRTSNGERNEFFPINELIFEARIRDLLSVQIKFLTGKDDRITGISSSFGYSGLVYLKNK